MTPTTLKTDYLIVGAGAAAMAFADTLLSETEADIVIVDRRHAPGGHWNDAYPFVRLHHPARYYGVNSTPLGSDAIQSSGVEAGEYDRAGAAEICAYYQRVMQDRFLASGRVRYFPQCDCLDDDRIVSRLSGQRYQVEVRRRRVDATHSSPSIPADSAPGFDIASGVDCIAVNDLVHRDTPAAGYTVIGGGKTGIDACLWLLGNGVDPDTIRWIKPREAWLHNRDYFQPGERVGHFLMGLALQMQAAAAATSGDDLFQRLEEAGQLRRVHSDAWPSMYKGATISDYELDQLRRIEHVVRLGHVRRIEPERILLDQGSLTSRPGTLYVHCAADGLRRRPTRPIFEPGRITLQTIRPGLIPFNAALTGFVEARRDEDAEKNRLCPPNVLPDTALDWARTTLVGLAADNAWAREPDIAAWLETARLNTTAGLRQRRDDPEVDRARELFGAQVRPGLERLTALVREAPRDA